MDYTSVPGVGIESMNPLLEFAPCAFCQLVESELEDRELDAEESLMYRHHLRVEHNMTV